MASFTTSNVSTNLVGRELSIASSFVKQYYTLLNKAPCFIHNFYSHDSTFIHGTIEMANEHYTEPVVGREKIKGKMEDLKLNDCRAKIKQIDCLETLAGGLVIQVIGELSNNGRPMRRFLQTFVLAPSADDSRQETGQQQQQQQGRPGGTERPTGLKSESGSSSSAAHNQKFFVLNSIFRYQDDGPENEFEDDVSVNHASATTEATLNGPAASEQQSNKHDAANYSRQPPHHHHQHHQQQQHHQLQHQQQHQQQPHSNMHVGPNNGPAYTDYSQNRRRPVESVVKRVESVEKLANNLDENLKLNKSVEQGSNNGGEIKRDLVSGSKVVVSNGTGNIIDKKNETSEKSTENGKTATDHALSIHTSNSSGAVSQLAPSSATVQAAPRPPPSNEPKTWANMVRNAHPPTTVTPVQVMNVNKPASSTEQQQQPQSQQQPQQQIQQQPQTQPQQHQQHNTNQTSSIQAQQPRHHHQHQQQQQQQQQLHQQPQQPQDLQQPQSQQQNLQINNNANNRRRHMMRKPSNKINGGGNNNSNNNNNGGGIGGGNGGRSLKTRPPRPPGAPISMASTQFQQQQQPQSQQPPQQPSATATTQPSAPPAASKPVA